VKHLPSVLRFASLTGFALSLGAARLAAQMSAPADAPAPADASSASAPAPAPAPAAPVVVPTGALMVTYIKEAPPQTLARDLMGVARQVYPGMQTEMLPLMLLGKYGYPTFPGVSATLPVTDFVYTGPTSADKGIVIAAQITADSPVRAGLNDLHLSVQTDSATGWTFMSTNPGLVALALTQSADLVKIASQPISVDFEWTLPTDNLAALRGDFQTAVQVGQAALNRASASSAAPTDSLKWFDFALQELQQLKQISLGIDCKPEAIGIVTTAVAQPGSTLAQLFSAPSTSAITAAQFVSADSPVIISFRRNIKVEQAFVDRLFADAEAFAGSANQAALSSFQKAIDIAMTNSDGTGVETFTYSGPSKMKMQVVAGGHLTDAQLVQALQLIYTNSMPALLQQINGLTGDMIQTSATLHLNAAKVGNVAVHEVITQNSVNPLSAVTNPAKQAALNAALQQQQLSPQHAYCAAVNGYWVTSSSFDDLSALIQAIQSGSPVNNSIASVLTPAPGVIVLGQVNLAALIADFGNGSGPASVNPTALAALQAINSAPLTFSVTLANNQGQFALTAPMASIVKVVQAMQARPAPPPSPNGANGANGASSSGSSAPSGNLPQSSVAAPASGPSSNSAN
jgi:hypothetical protein